MPTDINGLLRDNFYLTLGLKICYNIYVQEGERKENVLRRGFSEAVPEDR